MLNPGLIPQSLDDLRQIAPDRTEMDDAARRPLEPRERSLAGRTRVPRGRAPLRDQSAASHPASAELWPEVVYPLIARARWQRQNRPRAEVV